jgi:DNA-binding MarR family transcriptional regulator
MVNRVVYAVKPMAERFGFELPLLLMGAFRALIDDLNAELGRRGHPDVRPVHGFALQAVGRDGASSAELGRRLGVSKQAAAKTAAGLERLGYLRREADAGDRRARRLVLTPAGRECLAISAEVLGELHDRWADAVGAERLAALEDDLERLGGAAARTRLGDLPGWLR